MFEEKILEFHAMVVSPQGGTQWFSFPGIHCFGKYSPTPNLGSPVFLIKYGGSDGVWLLRPGYKRHCSFRLGFFRITGSLGSQLPWSGQCYGEDHIGRNWSSPPPPPQPRSYQGQMANHRSVLPWKRVLQSQSSLQMTVALAEASFLG